MIAKVIVDVKTNQTNRPFDYVVPESFETWVRPGMRVVVPFGPRKLQGFIVGIDEESEVKKLKPIAEVLDYEPVLTPELLKLGEFLTEHTLCFAISAYLAMLPAALKVKVKKQIRLCDPSKHSLLPKEVQSLFLQKTIWDIQDVLHLVKKKETIKAWVNEGWVEVYDQVVNHTRKKTIKMVKLTVNQVEFEQALLTCHRAKKQQQILHFLHENNRPVATSELLVAVKASRQTLQGLLEKGFIEEFEQEVYRDPYLDRTFDHEEKLAFTPAQKAAFSPIEAAIFAHRHETFLLHGITGSGKTEIYLQAIEQVINEGKEAIVLVPEISLTPMMVNRFKRRFGSEVAVMHSGLSHGEKYDEWRKIYRKEVKVVVGARSAIFAPFTNVGLIIIDEEHESSYKQEENPRYHARDVAIWRGKYHQCPIILGSATPILESYARAKKGVYHLLELQQRVNEKPLPTVEIVDMREELRKGNRSMFSGALFEKMQERLEKGEQIVLFLNRRGYSTFVMCRSCGHVVQCPHCDISLTYHRNDRMLKCHYCGFETPEIHHCPDCGSDHIRFFGTGTQKVEEELAKVLPGARVVRMDVDTTRKKGAHETLLRSFGEKKADILLGTQMIAKGLDFKDVTLVGVLAADSLLHLPDFRAAEKTFQLITQVSGRAGRHDLPGEVVVQSYTPDHYSIEFAADHNYHLFYETEMHLRRQFGYPPYYYLTLITISHSDRFYAMNVCDKITVSLQQTLSNKSIILGPVPSSIARVGDRYRFHCMIKYKSEPKIHQALERIIIHYQKEIAKQELQIQVDMNPYMMM